jgi:hypothetical protein
MKSQTSRQQFFRSCRDDICLANVGGTAENELIFESCVGAGAAADTITAAPGCEAIASRTIADGFRGPE